MFKVIEQFCQSERFQANFRFQENTPFSVNLISTTMECLIWFFESPDFNECTANVLSALIWIIDSNKENQQDVFNFPITDLLQFYLGEDFDIPVPGPILHQTIEGKLLLNCLLFIKTLLTMPIQAHTKQMASIILSKIPLGNEHVQEHLRFPRLADYEQKDYFSRSSLPEYDNFPEGNNNHKLLFYQILCQLKYISTGDLVLESKIKENLERKASNQKRIAESGEVTWWDTHYIEEYKTRSGSIEVFLNQNYVRYFFDLTNSTDELLGVEEKIDALRESTFPEVRRRRVEFFDKQLPELLTGIRFKKKANKWPRRIAFVGYNPLEFASIILAAAINVIMIAAWVAPDFASTEPLTPLWYHSVVTVLGVIQCIISLLLFLSGVLMHPLGNLKYFTALLMSRFFWFLLSHLFASLLGLFYRYSLHLQI
mgnify:CR=1 FL=1